MSEISTPPVKTDDPEIWKAAQADWFFCKRRNLTLTERACRLYQEAWLHFNAIPGGQEGDVVSNNMSLCSQCEDGKYRERRVGRRLTRREQIEGKERKKWKMRKKP
jgi:hypothetical protein